MTDPTPDTPGDIVPRTDRGLTEAGDRGHQAYVMAKIAEAATQVSLTAQQLEHIRNPQSWDRVVELWGDAKTLHDMLAFGHQHIHGHTPEQGWRQEYRRPVPGLGDRQHDNAKVVNQVGREIVVATTEYKAGGITVAKGLEQLAKERRLLATGRTRDVSEYIIRAARPPAVEVMREARKLAKEFPGKFVLIELSETEFRRYIDAGRPIAHAKAVERLGYLIEKVRDSPELTTAPRAIEGFILEIEKAKETGKPIGLEVLVGSRLELAALLEVDGRITQERDKIAREAADLRLKESQIVERVQAQQRVERHEQLSQLVGRVDREIVRSAVASVRVPIPEKGPGKAIDLQQLAGSDPTKIAMAKAMERAQADMVRAAQERAAGQRAVAEREALAKLVLPTPMHHAVAQMVLEQQRGIPGEITAEHVVAAEREVRERDAREARQAEVRAVRERENRELMERLAERYNQTLAQAAREQAAPLGRDKSEDQRREKQYPRLERDLRLDPARLVEKGIDAHAVDAIARGTVRLDESARAYVVEVGDRTVYVARDSEEAAVARRIQQVELGVDLQLVQVRELTEKGLPLTPAAMSREELAQERDKLERVRQQERDRPTKGRTATGKGRDGPDRGIERGL
ncbi:hypothetical protein ACIGO9_30125 [Nocardia asteroides]|uniref:hypothetical protein n=1 Tax=Nocardia asteroides TaxID=1824 RepID=UPI0037C9B7A2